MEINIIIVGVISGVALILGIKNWSKNKEITKDCILLKNEIHTLKEDVKRLEKSKNYNEEGDDIEEDEITHSLTYFRIAENWYGEGMIIKVNFKVGDYQEDTYAYDHDYVYNKVIDRYGQLPSWIKRGYFSNSRNIPNDIIQFCYSW